MNRCYNTDTKAQKNHHHQQQQEISSCLRSPGILLRQKSFHTLSELSRICHLTKNEANSNSKKNRHRFSVDDNILPTTSILTPHQRYQRPAQLNSKTDRIDDGSIDNDSKVSADNIVILRRPTKQQNNNSNCLKYYNYDNYNYNNKLKENHNKNHKQNAYENASKSNQKYQQHHNELPSYDQLKRDNSVFNINDRNNNNNNNNNIAYRWSVNQFENGNELLSNVTEIRTAISCTALEMEYLLPQHHTSTSTTTATTSSSASHPNHHNSTNTSSTTTTTTTFTGTNNNNNNNNNNNHVSSNAEKESKLLHITRHSYYGNHHNDAPNHVKLKELNNIPPTATTTSTSNTTVTGNDDENQHIGNGQNLFIHRQPAHARTKGGNTPPYRMKMSKKQLKLAQAQLDKLTQINLHLHALFSAVEHGHLDKARTILESTDIDVNSINADGLTALDVAVLSNNRSMTKMLLQHGAIEGTHSPSENIGSKLSSLLKEAELNILELSEPTDAPGAPILSKRASATSMIIGNTAASVTEPTTANEIEKQIGIWERRVKGIRRMLLGWEQSTRPDAPASVTADVTGDNSIALQILEPFEGAIGTKFKVQWSTRADFSNIVGERELIVWSSFHGNMGAHCYISGLTQGRRYFLRAACGNVKGWGPYQTAVPTSVVPSSWRDLDNREDRYQGRQCALDNLFTTVRLMRPADVSELSEETTNAQRRNRKKKTTSIKQLFSVASKFHKHLRRGIYLASIIYCEDKILVTSEDFPPAIEVDETYPNSLHSDYHWLMKVACNWEDAKLLRIDMERHLNSAAHFRTKLLSAVCHMQSALGLNDLGQLYNKPLRDSHGTVVLTCIQSIKNQKCISILNSRWLPINKLQKKATTLHEDCNINELLISTISEQIHYHQASQQGLSPGLYLGYLKMQCSVDQIQVVVPVKTPNVLPHYKVRDNSHITAEEWQILKRGSDSSSSSNSDGNPKDATSLPLQLELNANYTTTTTEVQRLFLYDLTNAARKLFTYMNIKPEEAATHRLYDLEVIEHSKEISFLIICPSVELSCAAPGQTEVLLQQHDDLASLSVQAFEMIHLSTYQPGIIQKYARLSCILELDTALANHSQREAFSTSELQAAKERLIKLHEFSSELNAVWKHVRWLMDVIAFARDKTTPTSLIMREILDFNHTPEESVGGSRLKRQLLRLPMREVRFTKSGAGRGSWPGPAGNSTNTSDSSNGNSRLEAEHSKSEQNLGLTTTLPTAILNLTASAQHTGNMPQVSISCASSEVSLRKNSGDSNTSHSYYSATESVASSSNEASAVFVKPITRTDDVNETTAATTEYTRTNVAMPQRKRTNSKQSTAPSASCTSAETPISNKQSAASQNTTLTDPKPTTTGISKVKAVSSVNLRDIGGQYLQSTLSALQKEIKTSTADEGVATSTKSLSWKSCDDDNTMAHHGGLATEIEKSNSNSSSTSTSNALVAPSSGIIQVYTAYHTGLATGTSLKLNVTTKTTAREVINLVVKQLNMAAVLKGNNGPIYTGDMLDNFCLVAVIGARERCLRDDFKPLQLQNPWKKGRLYVRQKHELLAAIEHSNRKSHLI